jgi:hypothetical protein
MPKKINLLDLAAAESTDSPLEIVRLGSDEIAFIPFTKEGEEIKLHYCSEIEIQSYVMCNGNDCVLCKVGRKQEMRVLLPVYLPVAGCVGVLPVSPSLRPFSLLPQISNVWKAEKPMVMFVTRQNAKFTVSTADLQKDVDGGESEIKRFLETYNSGRLELSSMYLRIDNEQLAGIEEITRMLALKGIRKDADNQRT